MNRPNIAGPTKASDILAEQHRNLKKTDASNEQIVESKNRLRGSVVKEFDARQQLQRSQLSKLQKRLERIKQLITSREQVRKQIIDRRVEELLNPNLQWGSNSAQHKSTRQTSLPTGERFPRTPDIIGQDPGEPIYNEQLKRFKFRMEKVYVTTAEIAVGFFDLYRKGDNPKVIGVWGDPITNSIIIVAPPEAEQAIRKTLAEMEAQMVGVEYGQPEPLAAQLIYLQRKRAELLKELTGVKLDIIGVEADGDKPDGERIKQLKNSTDRSPAATSRQMTKNRGEFGSPQVVTQIGGGATILGFAHEHGQVAAQVLIRYPTAATLKWQPDPKSQLKLPGRLSLKTGQILRAKLSKIPKYDGVELAVTIDAPRARILDNDENTPAK